MTLVPPAPPVWPRPSPPSPRPNHRHLLCRWLRPGNGPRGHPDDDEQRKYKLIVAALKKLCGGANTPIPEGMQVAVWVVRAPAASNQKGCVARVWRPLA